MAHDRDRAAQVFTCILNDAEVSSEKAIFQRLPQTLRGVVEDIVLTRGAKRNEYVLRLVVVEDDLEEMPAEELQSIARDVAMTAICNGWGN